MSSCSLSRGCVSCAGPIVALASWQQPSAPLCWLLRTSVQEIGMLRIMEQASLSKQVRYEYNERGPFCSYSSSNAPIFTKERFNLCCVCSPQSSNASVSAFSRSQNVFRVGSNLRRLPFCSARSPILPEENPCCSRKTPCYDTN